MTDAEELAAWRRIGGTLRSVLEDADSFNAQLSPKQRAALAAAYTLLPPEDRYDRMVEFTRRNP